MSSKEHDDPVAYWSMRYFEAVAEHDKELLVHRKHLANKYKPVFDAILSEYRDARDSYRSNENSNQAPPKENSNRAGASVKIEKEARPNE